MSPVNLPHERWGTTVHLKQAVLLFILFYVVGCAQVGVEIETTTHEDGSSRRTITYIAREVDRKTLASEYKLPVGSEWSVTEKTQLGQASERDRKERVYIYRAEGTFQKLSSDYAKRDDQIPPHWSKNSITIHRTSDAYEYAETLSDTANPQELRSFWEDVVRFLIAETIRFLRETLLRDESDFAVLEIQRGVTTAGLGYFNQIWNRLKTIESQEDAKKSDEFIAGAEEFFINQLDRWWQTEGRFYPKDGARQLIVEAMEQLPQNYLKESTSAFDEKRIKRCGGAYANRGYHFKVTVTMPNNITESNAHSINGKIAIWEFDPRFFLLKPYTLRAKAKR